MPGPRVRRGEQVTLRTVETEDVPFVQRASTNPPLRRALGARHPDSRAELEDRFDDDGTDRFLVCLDDAGPGAASPDAVDRIGYVGVADAAYKRPELAYWLVPAVHGQGYGSDAVGTAVDYTFRTYDTPAVEAAAYACNDASRGLLASLGFTQEGRHRKYMFVDGAHRDMIVYGLLREAWAGWPTD